VDYDRIAQDDVLHALRERNIQPLIAVTPTTLPEVAALVDRVRSAGVPVGLWPLLDDLDGRWCSLHTLPEFRAHVRRMLDDLTRRDLLPSEIAIDLEPPVSGMRAALKGQPALLRARQRPGADAAALAAMVGEIRALGIRASAAVMPFAVERGASGRGWQQIFGTPLDDIPFDRVSVMAYSSLFEGYSRGVLRRRHARALVERTSALVVAAQRDRASVSLGCVGVGALGDEKTLHSPEQLREDVAIATRAGARDLAVFNLRGMLRRPPFERWLDALVEEPQMARPAPVTVRASAFAAASRILGASAHMLRRQG
jgi:hypothetical protein